MPRESLSPIDLPAPPLARPALGWTSGAFAVATLLLLLANAVALRDWLEDLPPSTPQAQAAAAAAAWVVASEAAGIGRPRAWLHARWKAVEAARF